MQEEILETTLNGDNIVETEITAIQKDMVTDHSQLTHLDYESSGHTGFQPAGNYIEDSNYVHTDNNYTTEEKTKLSNLENYDDTEIKADINSLEGIETAQNEEIVNIKATLSDKADKSEIPDISGKQDLITSTNKLDASYIDDSLSNNKFVTPTEKTNWNNKSDFSGDYNDLSNKPTIPVVPSNVSAFTNDSGYLTNTDFKTINNETIVGSGNIDVGGGSEIPTITENTKIYELDNGIYLLNGGGYYIYFGNSTTYYVQNAYGYLFVTDSYIDNRKQFQMILNSFNYKIPNAGQGSAAKAIVSGVSFSTSTSGSDVTKTHYSALVNTTIDAQTISTKKTFTTLPESSVTPTTNNQLTNKSYVDNAINNAIGTALGGSY